MRNSRFQLPFSLISLSASLIAVLAITYIGLIAAVMSYAALTIQFSQSVTNDQASVATLEAQYLAVVARITTTNYIAAGYVVPSVQIDVPTKSVTALR